MAGIVLSKPSGSKSGLYICPVRKSLGPSAPWVEDDVVYSHVLRDAAKVLQERLRQRLSILDREDLCADDIVQEVRRQISESAVDGRISYAADLNDLAMDLLLARENNRKLL